MSILIPVFIFRNMIKSFKNGIVSLIFATTADHSLTRVNVAIRKILSEVYTDAKFDVDNVTEHSFIQGKLANCGMVAAMASLANNRELINKVIPKGQNFKRDSLSDSKEVSEFQFNLYKYGKPHRAVVNESLFFWDDPVKLNKLYYSDGRDRNFVGPLLEKALMETHFKGDYKSAGSVDAVNVLTSFTNSFFEEFYDCDLIGLGYKLEDLITHGKKN